MKNWIKRHKFWTVWLIALGVMFTLIGVVDVWTFAGALALSAVCYGVYCAVRWFATRPPEQTIPQRAAEWAKMHKFWVVFATIVLVVSLVGAGAYVVGLLIGLVLPVYAFWWLSQRGKRKKEAIND